MSAPHFWSNPLFPVPARMAIAPRPGEVIANSTNGNTYRIGEKIGGGYFSVVYGCVDAASNQLAAKVFKPIGTYESVRASAMEEFNKLVLLRHPHITQVFDIFECRGTFYVITERCTCSLEELFFRRPALGPRLFMPVASCLLQAINSVHASGYVHQDIHMGNVLASFSGRLLFDGPNQVQFKLSDLGVAKFFTQLSPSNTRADWLLAPELIEPQEFGRIDHRIDIYHVALLLLQLSYSRKLFFSAQEVLSGMPRQMAGRLQPPYCFVLEKALSRHVASRPASAKELLDDLRECM
jgi:eukaryotic-like serine/threonine-protein kinase